MNSQQININSNTPYSHKLNCDIVAESDMSPRTISILGSTGSIGKSAIEIITANSNRYKVAALTANNNLDLLVQQAELLHPDMVVIGNESLYSRLKQKLGGTGIMLAAGSEAINEAASLNSDVVLGAIVGAAGLEPILTALKTGKIIAIANKEPLVCAGEIICKTATQYGATIIPVDSEHSAIFQVFDFNNYKSVAKIILTASGGPFRELTLAEMAKVTAKQAVQHPNWNMGAKISVDSATMMNKGLEMIEAYHLFPIEKQQIEVVIHPESIIHSMVEYQDGSILAQLGVSDMQIPIAYAMAWPHRIKMPNHKFNFSKLHNLHFEPPDINKFPALQLARHALQAEGAKPIVLNAANETAVEQFLKGNICFLDIINLVEKSINAVENENIANFDTNNLQDIIETDLWARQYVMSLLNRG